VLHFLNNLLYFLCRQPLDSKPGRRLRADLQHAADGTFEHLPASEIPPTPAEFVALADGNGLESAYSEVERYGKSLPIEWVVNESTFNSLGYNLLGQKKITSAISAFRWHIRDLPMPMTV
jgi:hypothetical protein